MFRNGLWSLCAAALSSVVVFAARGEAATISQLDVQPGSTFQINLQLLDGAVNETLTTDISGTIGPVDLGWANTPGGPTPDPLQIHGAALQLSDADSTPGSPFLFQLIGVGADLSGPEVTGFMPDGNMNSFDLQGYLLTLNQGQLVVTGSTSAMIDLAATPFPLYITDPGAVIAKVTETPTMDPLVYDVSMDITFDFTAVIPPSDTLPLPVTVYANGTITATGQKTVPEPGCLALLMLASGALALVRRR